MIIWLESHKVMMLSAPSGDCTVWNLVVMLDIICDYFVRELFGDYITGVIW